MSDLYFYMHDVERNLLALDVAAEIHNSGGGCMGILVPLADGGHLFTSLDGDGQAWLGLDWSSTDERIAEITLEVRPWGGWEDFPEASPGEVAVAIAKLAKRLGAVTHGEQIGSPTGGYIPGRAHQAVLPSTVLHLFNNDTGEEVVTRASAMPHGLYTLTSWERDATMPFAKGPFPFADPAACPYEGSLREDVHEAARNDEAALVLVICAGGPLVLEPNDLGFANRRNLLTEPNPCL